MSTPIRELLTGDNTDSASFVLGGAADMAISKSVTGSINGLSGSILTYTLSYSNHGTTGANNVIITDTLP